MASHNDFEPVEDMTTLPSMDEQSLLRNLQVRYENKDIYTYTGSILVSVNPYEILPLYNLDVVRSYFGVQRGVLPPHIFAIADAAYKSMVDDKKNQSIIISGESGAGKTEATKLIIQYLAARTNKRSEVERMIVESSPILEAFGNAKTVRNNNSSRFGKFIEIHFNELGHICGARIIQYLLEKSRVVQQAKDERNYHIFYQLCAGADQALRDELQLLPPAQYNYLNQSGCIEIENVDDQADFQAVCDAMQLLGLSEDMQRTVFRIVAAVLYLGNVEFKSSDAVQGTEGSAVSNPDTLAIVGRLLQVDAGKLAEALTIRHNLIRGQKFVVPLAPQQAVDARDALAKALYKSVFSWLVEHINSRICNPKLVVSFIGVLDIFGFENFKVNSFEQFCINYCNEKLQQHFNQHIFKLEQEEYEREKLGWAKISFNDNQECLDLVEKRPLGILSLLDEECKFPQATDKSLLEKLHKNHEKHPYYEKPRVSHSTFVVKHYAGEVSYEIKGFLDKNSDTLRDDLLLLLQGSGMQFIREQFDVVTEDKDAGGTKKKMTESVGAQFKGQLIALMGTLSATSPHYVRCIKPNTIKKPSVFDAEMVMAQLRYAGMMETIRIRKLGFPVRYTHQEFFDKYRIMASERPSSIRILPKVVSQPKIKGKKAESSHDLMNLPPPPPPLTIADDEKLPPFPTLKPGADLTPHVKKLMEHLSKFPGVISAEWLPGLTKVFMRDAQYQAIEELRAITLGRKLCKAQSVWRMYSRRKRYLAMRKAAVALQARISGFLARQAFLQKCRSVVVLQAFARMLRQRKRFRILVDKVRVLPTPVRGWLARKHFSAELAEKKENERRLAEIAKQEMDEKLRKEAEEKERQRQAEQQAIKAEQAKHREEEDRKRRDEEEQLRRQNEEKRKAEEKKQELKALNQLDDFTTLSDMLKAQEANNLTELDDLVGDMSNLAKFSFEASTPGPSSASSSAFVYDPTKYEMESDDLDNISLADLLMGLKTTAQLATNHAAGEDAFKLPEGADRIQAPTPAPAPAPAAAPAKAPEPRAPSGSGESRPRSTSSASRTSAASALRDSLSSNSNRMLLATPPPPLASVPEDPLPPPPPIPVPAVPSSASIPPPLAVPAKPSPPLPPRTPPVGDTSLPPPLVVPPPLGDAPSLPPPPDFGSMLPPPPMTSFPSLPDDLSQSLADLDTLSASLPSLLPPPPLTLPSTAPPTLSAPAPVYAPPPMIPTGTAISQPKQLQRIVEVDELPLYSLPEYAARYFRALIKANAANRKKAGLESEYSFQKSSIKAPLLDSVADKTEEAKLCLEIFSRILAYTQTKKQASNASELFGPAQFVLQKGLANENLRDEIYAQLMKQTYGVASSSRDALVRGWELLLFCSATFLPSTHAIKYVGSYFYSTIDSEGTDVVGQSATLALKNMQRLVATGGTRKFVPSTPELSALRDIRPVMVRVTFPDGGSKGIFVDSATTIAEMSADISARLRIRGDPEVNGFSLYEVFNGIERDLGPDDRICDALSRFETLLQTLAAQRMVVSQSLLFKRRLWMDPKTEMIMTEGIQFENELIYHQVYHDIMTGSLPCSDDEHVAFAALRMQCEFGDFVSGSEAVSDLAKYLPKRLVQERRDDVTQQYKDLRGVSREDAKRAILSTAQTLPLYGFNVFHAKVKMQNMPANAPTLPTRVIVAINPLGFHYFDPVNNQVIMAFSFPLIEVKLTSATVVTLIMGPNATVDLETNDGSRMANLHRDYHAIIKRTARYARALKDNVVDDTTLLSFRRADIITIAGRDESCTWYSGVAHGQEGAFHEEHVQLLHGASSPNPITLPPLPTLFAGAAASRPLPVRPLPTPGASSSPSMSSSPAPDSPQYSTMRGVASDYSTIRSGSVSEHAGAPSAPGMTDAFAQYTRTRFRKALNKMKKPIDPPLMLSFSREPIKDSLIEHSNPKMSKKAVSLFQHIMAYMEDYPAPGKLNSVQLAQEVVQNGINGGPDIRDEIYCQIWRQITNNSRTESNKKGNELLAFCASCFLPSPALANVYIEALNARKDPKDTPLVKAAAAKMELLQSRISHRKYPPSSRELEYIKANEDATVVKVQLCDGTTKAIFVRSGTTARDANMEMINKLLLGTHSKWFGLCEVNDAQGLCRPLLDSEFVCDLMSKWETSPAEANGASKFVFRRKYIMDDPEQCLEQERYWTDDRVGFELFFNQAKQDLLEGRLPVTLEEAAYTAALLHQLHMPNSQKAAISKDHIDPFIPRAVAAKQSLKQWISAVELHLFELVGQTPEYTKMVFIKTLAKVPIFGSTQFQVLHKESGNRAVLAINRKGVQMFENIAAREPKMLSVYRAIGDTTLTDDAFVIQTGNLMKMVKFTFVSDCPTVIRTTFQVYSDNVEQR